MELTAELLAVEAQRRYVLAHEERRHFYTAYRTGFSEQHLRFCDVSAQHFAKARLAEAESHAIANELRVLRARILQQHSDEDAEYESSASMRLHARFARSSSSPERVPLGTIVASTPEHSLKLHYPADEDGYYQPQIAIVAPTQDQRDQAARYWYNWAIGLGIDEPVALRSMQRYLFGERDDEVADLLRQQVVEERSGTADERQLRDDNAYRMLAEATLPGEAKQDYGPLEPFFRSAEGEAEPLNWLYAEPESYTEDEGLER